MGLEYLMAQAVNESSLTMTIKQRAIESAQSRLKQAEYWLSVSDGNADTIKKKTRAVEIAA
jgi:hypothetical protein